MACGSSDDEKNPGTGGAGGGGGSGGSANPDAGPIGPAGTTDWTMLGYDRASTYWNRAETKITKQNVGTLVKAWEFEAGGIVTGAPITVGNRVFVNANLSGVTAIDATTGTELWKAPQVSGSASPAYADGVVYAAGNGDAVFALDAENDNTLWEHDADSHPMSISYSSPILSDDYVFIGGSSAEELVNPPAGEARTFRGFLVAINRTDGTLGWKKFTLEAPNTGAAIWSSVSLDDSAGLVFASTGNNYEGTATDTSDSFLALPLATGGDFTWKAQMHDGDLFTIGSGGRDYDFGANPVLFEVGGRKLAAAGSKGGDVWVVDRTDGTVIEHRNFGPGSAFKGGVFISGAWDGSSFLVAVNGGTSDAPGAEPAVADGGGTSVLFALDPLTLDIKWERQLGATVYSPITVANGVGFVGNGKKLQAFDTATGENLFEFPTEATIASAPVISDGRVFFGSGMQWSGSTPGTKVYALKLP